MSNPFHPRGNRRFAQGTPRAHKRNAFVALASSLLAMVLACAGNGNQSAHVRPAQSGSSSAPVAKVITCAHATELTARVPTLLDQGKLRRAQRVLAKADALCPDVHAGHQDVDALIVAELGQWRDAEKAIADIEASKDKVAMGTPLLAKAKQIVAASKLADAAAKANHDDVDKAIAMVHQDRDALEASAAVVSHDAAKVLADKYEAVWNLAHVHPEALYWAGHFAKAAGDGARAQVLLDRAWVELEKSRQDKIALHTPNGVGGATQGHWSADSQHLEVLSPSSNKIYAFAKPSMRLDHVRVVDAKSFKAWSADGTLMVTQPEDDRIELVEAPDQIVKQQFLHPPMHNFGADTIEHKSEVREVILSQDNRRLLTVTTDYVTRLWDATHGTLLREIAEGPQSYVEVALSPDGKIMATNSAKRGIRIWDTATGRLLQTIWSDLNGQTNGVEGTALFKLAFSPDNNILAGTSGVGYVAIFDVASGRMNYKTWVGGSKLEGLALSADSRLLATPMGDHGIVIMDVATGRAQQSLQDSCLADIWSAFSPDSKFFAASCSGDGTRVWDVATGKLVHIEPESLDAATSLAMAPDGQSMVVGHAGWRARLWALSTLVPDRAMEVANGGMQVIAYAPDNKAIATGGRYGAITLWDSQGVGRPFAVDDRRSSTDFVAYSPDGKWLATSGHDDFVQLYDAATGQQVKALVGARYRIVHIAFSPDSHRLAAVIFGGPMQNLGRRHGQRDQSQPHNSKSGCKRCLLPRQPSHRRWVR